MRKVFLLGLAFVFFSAGVLGALQIWAPATWPELRTQLSALGPLKILGIAFLLSLMYLADAWRYRLLVGFVSRPLSWGDALFASAINLFFAWSTPGAVVAAPATAFFMAKRGVPTSVSLLAAFGKSLTGTALLTLAALLALPFTGQGQNYSAGLVYGPATGLLLVSFFLCLPLLAIFYPQKFVFARASARWQLTWNETLAKLSELCGHEPLRRLALMLLSHALYFAVLVLIVALLVPPEGVFSGWKIVPWGLLFLALLYLSPTPGGVGILEGAAALLWSSFMPVEAALGLMVLLRLALVYLPLLVGALALFLAGGWRR